MTCAPLLFLAPANMPINAQGDQEDGEIESEEGEAGEGDADSWDGEADGEGAAGAGEVQVIPAWFAIFKRSGGNTINQKECGLHVLLVQEFYLICAL